MPEQMPATPQQHVILAQYAERLEGAEHGSKGALMSELTAELGVARPTAHRWLDAHLVRDRKRRSDAGKLSLTLEEAHIVSAALMSCYRQHGKRIGKLTNLVRQLRADQKIRAEYIDASTGEIVELSDSSISRALRAYNLHPEQLRRPTPHVHLSSPHPNHTWQADASVCVVYYLPTGGIGICELKDAVHYKNRPENLKAIEAFRVIRYIVADHCSGVFRWRYYPHAESAQHTVRHLAWAMAPKADANDPFHGRPRYLMVDPGATSAGLVKRFCKRLEIELIVHKPGNARVTGSVEIGQDIVECMFESGLRFVRDQVQTFEDLNRLADLFQAHFNAKAKHSRHGKSRYAKWLEIKPDELCVTPGEAILLSLATEEPEVRKVEGDLTVRFKSRRWQVIDVPGVMRGGTVRVHWHPFVPDTAMAVFDDSDGREIHLPLPEVTLDQHGFPNTAIQIGTGYRALPDTVLETNRKAVMKLAAGEARISDADAVSKKPGFVPFGGTFNPFRAEQETPLPTYLPRAGTPMEVEVPKVEPRTLTPTMAALRLQAQLDDAWRPEYFAWLEQRFPNGIGEDQLARLAAQWSSTGDVDQPREAAC